MKYEKGTFVTVPNIDIVIGQHPITQALYMHLCKRANQDGMCFPSRKVLAEDVGVSETSIKRHTKKLLELGILRKTRRFNNNEETSSEYEILVGGAGENLPPNIDENENQDNGLSKAKKDDKKGKQNTPRARETLPRAGENRPRAPQTLPRAQEDRPRAREDHRTKSTELNPLTKTNNNNNTEVLEDKSSKEVFGDPFINEILEAIKNNHDGIIDGTQIENRRYGRLLRDKIKSLKGFDGNYTKFIDYIIKNTDEFQIANTASPKKLYYNLATLLAKIKTRSNKKGEFERDVLGSDDVDFLGNFGKDLGGNKI